MTISINGHQIETGGISAQEIPTTWAKKAVLTRPCGMNQPERFAFFALPDGRVAQVNFHPMNGVEDMFFRISDREFMAGEYQELLDGERFTERTATYGGGVDCRRGRRIKATRVA